MDSTASPTASKHRIPGIANPVVAAAEKKWLFTDADLERTPSRLDNIQRDQEDYIRHRAVEFIWQVSMMLKMPVQTTMTATVFMHRFLMRYSLQGQYPEQAPELMHPKIIAAVALFVAFKVEETMRRMKDFVIACCRVAMKQPNMVVDEQSKDYWKWRDLILQNESVMLEFLCFDLQLESPHRILWEYSQFLKVPNNKPLQHATYAFLNDSTYTVLCLQFPARVVAAAALYAAARHCEVSFPDDSKGRPWWEQLDVRVEDLVSACKLIVQIYERVQQSLSKAYPNFAIGDSDPNDPTRLFHSNPLVAPDVNSSLSTPAADSPAANGRKRSREPDSQAPENHHPSPIPPPPAQSVNGERSPKRQRTISPGHNSGTPSAPRPRIPLQAMGLTSGQPKAEEQQPKPDIKDDSSHPQVASGSNPDAKPTDETSAEEGEISDDKGANHHKPASPPKEAVEEEGGGSEEGEI